MGQNGGQLRAVFDGGPIGMTILTADLRFARVNAALCRLLGFSVPELRELTLVAVAHPDDRTDLERRLARLFDEGVPVSAEDRLRTKADHVVTVNATTALLRSEPEAQADAITQGLSEQQ